MASLEPASQVIQHAGAGPVAARQEGPHAHSILPDPSGRYVLAADLGIDKVMVYRIDLDRKRLEPADPPSADLAPGAGPRHLAFHPNGRWLYVTGELDSTLTVFSWDAEQGRLQRLQAISTLAGGLDGHELSGRGRGRAVGPLRLHVEPGARQHRHLRGGSSDWRADAGRA